MTIIEAQNTLIGFFMEHDVFNPEEDMDTVLPKDSITREIDAAIFVAGLTVFEGQHIVMRIQPQGKLDGQFAWALTKPLAMRTQSVEIDIPIAKAIADTLNDYSEAVGGDRTAADVFALNERHLAGLVQIIQHLSGILNAKK